MSYSIMMHCSWSLYHVCPWCCQAAGNPHKKINALYSWWYCSPQNDVLMEILHATTVWNCLVMEECPLRPKTKLQFIDTLQGRFRIQTHIDERVLIRINGVTFRFECGGVFLPFCLVYTFPAEDLWGPVAYDERPGQGQRLGFLIGGCPSAPWEMQF